MLPPHRRPGPGGRDGELPLPGAVGLDPIHYVTLPGAAWDAVLRHSARETPIHLITDKQAYKDARASVMGGSQQPRAGREGLQL